MRRASIVGSMGLALALAAGAEAQPSDPALTPPRLLEAPEVVLPAGSAPLPTDAAVVVEIVITEEGRVAEARVVETPREDLGPPVVDAVLRARFAPATRDGRPIASRVRFRYAIAAPEADSDADADAAADADADAD
ncbi:MAG: TonB family protein, partial [Myxococcales bacterium]|nr:TonB family protein [Myxococcales bacterium]